MPNDDEVILLERYQAWADLGWVLPGLTNRTHTHICTGCRAEVSCLCIDLLAKQTVCTQCLMKASA